MPFTTLTDLGDALTDATRRSFSLGFKLIPLGGRAMFDVRNTDKKVETFNSAVMDDFASGTGEGENYAAFDPTLGDELTLTQSKITASLEVTKEQQMYDQYGVTAAMEAAKGLGTMTAKRIELDLQQLISQGSATSYTDKDGNTVTTTSADAVALFSNSHTVNGSSSTYDNLDSTAFGQTGLEAVENLFRNFLNQDGQIINRVPTAIFSTSKPALVNLIREYNKGMNHIEDANRGVNVYQGRYDHIVLDYLDVTNVGARDATKDDYWGLVIAKDKNLRMRVSQNPKMHPGQLVQRNRNMLFQADAHYAYGVEDPVCIAISQA